MGHIKFVSKPTLAEVVKLDMHKEFYHVYGHVSFVKLVMITRLNLLNQPVLLINTMVNATRQHNVQKTTAGLFKLEYEGDGVISLCSKSYHCFDDYNKTNTKGPSKTN